MYYNHLFDFLGLFIKLRKKVCFCCLLLLPVIMSACTANLSPLTDSELDDSAGIDQALMFSGNQSFSDELSLEEAIARALKYNLDKRAKIMEEALALNQMDLDEYSLLPNLLANGTYSDRSEFSASNSKDRGDGPSSSSGYSYSSDRTVFRGDLNLSWTMLDFGVSYFNARQNADRVLIINERRRKVVHNLVREVQFSYWRMVAAQKLSDRVKMVILRAEQGLADAEMVEKEKLQTPTQILQFQKKLLQNIRKLETVSQQLSTAQIELAALINVPPAKSFRVVIPSTEILLIPKWSIPLEKMELLAFHKNPDIREKLYQNRIGIADAKKSLLALFPGIDLTGARNSDSNSFQDVNRWFSWSTKLSLNVLKLLSAPNQVKYNQAQKSLSQAQLLALRMAIIAQVHVANKQYINSLTQYKRADKLYLLDKRLSEQIAKRQESDLQSMLDRISQETAAIDSELRRYETYSNVIAAVAQIHSTIGIRVIGPKNSKKDLTGLAHSIAKVMKNWMTGYAIVSEVKRINEFKVKKELSIVKNNRIPEYKGILAWAMKSLDAFSFNGQNRLKKVSPNSNNSSQKYNKPTAIFEGNHRQKLNSIKSVTMLLNNTPAAGPLTKSNVRCGFISKLKSKNGWVQIKGKNIQNQNIKGWVHKVYFSKLIFQCQNNRIAFRF